MSESQTATATAAAQSTGSVHQTTAGSTTTAPAPGQYVGDNILPDADCVYDQRKTINAAPEDVWPWLVQWGKGRGGWYVPSKFEKVLPEKYRSAPTIDPKWQDVKVGDVVPDYGLGKKKTEDDYHLEVAAVETGRALVYKGERMGMNFTWALLLESAGNQTVLHLRFRSKSLQTGWKAKVAQQLGKVADGMMASAMFPGIADRVEQQEKGAHARATATA